MALESLSHAMARLEAAGYTEELRAEDGGLRHVGADHVIRPEDAVVHEIVRFEGESDPDDEAALFALECPTCSIRGTYVVAFGPDMPAEDVEVVPRLPNDRGGS